MLALFPLSGVELGAKDKIREAVSSWNILTPVNRLFRRVQILLWRWKELTLEKFGENVGKIHSSPVQKAMGFPIYT